MRVSVKADLEQAVPVGVVARQPGNFQAEHHADLAQADGGDQLLEALAVAFSARMPEVAVDDHDLFECPAESDGAFAQCVLPLGALGVLEDLAQRALANVQIGEPGEVTGRDLLVLSVHARHVLRLLSAISVSTLTSSLQSPVSGVRDSDPTPSDVRENEDEVRGGHALIQSGSPTSSSRASPRGVTAGTSPTACARTAS
jgi:hypothetical protein